MTTLLLAALASLTQETDAALKRLAELNRLLHQEDLRALASATLSKDPSFKAGYQKLWTERHEILNAVAGPKGDDREEIEEQAVRRFDAPLHEELKESFAQSTLLNLHTTQADFRGNDRDENRVLDYWVGDVFGFHFLRPEGADRFPLKLLPTTRMATADAAPLKIAAYSQTPPEHPAPYWGYFVAALAAVETTEGTWVKYDDGTRRNPSRFGFCAVPADSKPVKPTFIINENRAIWKKDTGGKRPEGFPLDPAKAGWVKARG